MGADWCGDLKTICDVSKPGTSTSEKYSYTYILKRSSEEAEGVELLCGRKRVKCLKSEEKFIAGIPPNR